RHSGTSLRVSAIAWNTVRDQPGMGVRDQWNTQAPIGQSKLPASPRRFDPVGIFETVISRRRRAAGLDEVAA
ncbi:hypothetical protein, partial [Roseateles saccharophilus]